MILRIKQLHMKITLIYDNTAFQKDLQADWGFSALVEAENTRILFDTGANGEILLGNMEKMGIDPSSIDEVFISHAHFDHTGGLSAFLNKNKSAKIYIPPSFRGLKGRDVISITQPTKIHENIFSTGQLDGIEQSLCVQTEKGIVIIAGCSHPSMRTILDTARQFGTIYGIIGGLHGFSDFALFRDLEFICPVHCTQHIPELKRRYPEKYSAGGAGKVIEI
jgi:7,8-dihydropterin-6-yl-methyl-4-(beta-D-ribofuranosyl)aminobenzene 5'-phosphate synthase